MADILQPGDIAYYVNGQFVHVDLVTETVITETPNNEVSPPAINTAVAYKLSKLGDIHINDEVVGSSLEELMAKLEDNIIYDVAMSPPLSPMFSGRFDSKSTLFSKYAAYVTNPGYYLRNGYLHTDIVDGLQFDYTSTDEGIVQSGRLKLSQMSQMVPAIYVYPDTLQLATYLAANIIYDTTV